MILGQNTTVLIKGDDGHEFRGIVVGKCSDSVIDKYVIKCTDDHIPNENYSYDTCIVPGYMITLIDR